MFISYSCTATLVSPRINSSNRVNALAACPHQSSTLCLFIYAYCADSFCKWEWWLESAAPPQNFVLGDGWNNKRDQNRFARSEKRFVLGEMTSLPPPRSLFRRENAPFWFLFCTQLHQTTISIIWYYTIRYKIKLNLDFFVIANKQKPYSNGVVFELLFKLSTLRVCWSRSSVCAAAIRTQLLSAHAQTSAFQRCLLLRSRKIIFLHFDARKIVK